MICCFCDDEVLEGEGYISEDTSYHYSCFYKQFDDYEELRRGQWWLKGWGKQRR